MRATPTKVISLLVFLLVTYVNLKAQYPLLKHFGQEDGLPSSTIYAFVQDKDGFIWFGTDVGVSRFDGRRFQNFSASDGLSDNYVISVRTDSRGRVWFLGFNGTVSYWFEGKVFNASNDPLLKNIITSTTFVDLFEDNENRLWFISQSEYIILENEQVIKPDSSLLLSHGIVINGSNGQLIINHDKSYIKRKGSFDFKPLTLKYSHKAMGGFWRANESDILFISKAGVVKQSDTLQQLVFPLPSSVATAHQPGIVLTNDSLLWIGTVGKGVYCYDYKQSKNEPIIFLKDKMTGCLLLDREGNIWISTLNDGLYMIPEWGRRVKVYTKENGLPDNHCNVIQTLNNGEVLLGLNHGNIASISGNTITNLPLPSNGTEANKVLHILKTGNSLWIASDKGIVHRNKSTGCNHYLEYKMDGDLEGRKLLAIKDLSNDAKSLYIISGFNIYSYPLHCKGKVDHSPKLLNIPQSRMYSLHADKSGELWYGSRSGLQSKKNGQIYNHATEHVLLSKGINSISETDDSTLVLATYGYGLLFYRNGKILKQVTMADGLESDICRKVFIYKKQVYVATPAGVSAITYENGNVSQAVNMNTGNFLPSNDVNDVFANDSDIYVATADGASIIGNWALNKIKPDVPLLYLTEVRVNDTVVAAHHNNYFSHKQSAFKFTFIGIYFQLPKGVNYRYKIKDKQEWQYTSNNSVDFSLLAPGTYRFQVQARIQNGEWSGLKTFGFVINPPFWNEWWFLLLVALGFFTVMVLIVRMRLKILRNRKEEKARLEKQIMQLEQQALQTLMNPHFVFNVMNSIQHFINVSDKMAANRYLADFAKLIRFNLNISLKRYIMLEEEINYLKLYLSFETLRFRDNLTYEICIDPQIDISDTTIAVMMIQPFIENAIWHGILPTNQKGHICITFSKASNDLLKVIIEDDGIGINDTYLKSQSLEETNKNHALSMTSQRLRLLGKASGQQLHIKYQHVNPEQTYKGTSVEILLPSTF